MPNILKAGDVVRLRENALPNARVREFKFVRMQGDKVVLAHEDEYEWEVDMADIDLEGISRAA
jgi:hypothetical protein